jgi:hypothetical protein
MKKSLIGLLFVCIISGAMEGPKRTSSDGELKKLQTAQENAKKKYEAIKKNILENNPTAWKALEPTVKRITGYQPETFRTSGDESQDSEHPTIEEYGVILHEEQPTQSWREWFMSIFKGNHN